MDQGELRRQIIAIQTDVSLTDAEKAKKRQALLSGSWQPSTDATDKEGPAKKEDSGDKGDIRQTTIFDESLKCTMCMELCNRPITAPCQHNFCLGCFTKWSNQGKKTCPTCRHPFPAKFATNPRINTALASAIRMAKLGVQRPNATKSFEGLLDKDRPDEAFTTDRAVRAGRANAASGRIRVTVPGDWFGPIPPEHDPERGQGVQVGDSWKDRLDCRQWGAHFPHVAGIAGQSDVGAQSVVLSGGYEDDKDEGEWFLYTGSGGRDLSGNKRVNKVQSSDQKFEKSNKALLVSCQKGLPVRVVRSHKEKRSSYAPPEAQPVRYDGIYRIVRAYQKPGEQGKLVCRYLFMRCDNAPAPWATEEGGSSPWANVPAEAKKEIDAVLKGVKGKVKPGKVFENGADPWWDYDEEKKTWGWTRAPPTSQKMGGAGTSEKGARKKLTEHERALREFQCKLCSGTLKQPLSTPCGHHFCMPCIEKLFQGVGNFEVRASNAGRPLRERKSVKPCPTCKADIADFLQKPQINRGMVDVIAKLEEAVSKAAVEAAAEAAAETRASGAALPALSESSDPARAAEEDYEALAQKEEGAAPSERAECTNGGSELCSEAVPMAEDELRDAAGGRGAGNNAKPSYLDEPVATIHLEKAGKTDTDLKKLCDEFPQLEPAIVEGILKDEDGDVQEAHACLRRLARNSAAAERKAAKRATDTTDVQPPAKKGKKGKGSARAKEI